MCVQRSLEIENLKVIKYPLILVLTAHEELLPLKKEIFINKKKYILNSFVTRNGQSYEMVARNGNKWIKNGEEWCFERQRIVLVFYQIEKMLE